ncbi:hypothetical protein M407DRAFT_241131 [Tulasnella calospora MUT 4182]|uniref:Uncharacterized protein n=1 Tax=Tulasnella calospora MUT 4182 TaxID=1051891 RepID=A0A0C3QV26_9AGAM|nr:hypothetical protein M407DRAFT_241131 [Tulasnella calospora MUT 4182]
MSPACLQFVAINRAISDKLASGARFSWYVSLWDSSPQVTRKTVAWFPMSFTGTVNRRYFQHVVLIEIPFFLKSSATSIILFPHVKPHSCPRSCPRSAILFKTNNPQSHRVSAHLAPSIPCTILPPPQLLSSHSSLQQPNNPHYLDPSGLWPSTVHPCVAPVNLKTGRFFAVVSPFLLKTPPLTEGSLIIY